MLDTLQTFETPEGVELGLKLAGPAPRAIAWSIDFVLKLVLLVMSLVLLGLGGVGSAAQAIVYFAVLWLYNVLFEMFTNGATPGKKLMGLRVVNTNGTPVGWGGSVLRNLVRFVDMLPVLYGFGILATLLNQRFQRLGDIAANTVVVYQSPPSPPATATSEAAEPLRVPLSVADQRWILAYSERGSRLSKERLVELAEVLEPVTGKRGEEAADRLSAHGNWLAGRS
ncbi:MAG: RDD family protein [Pseudomonadota bacterium]